MLQHAAFMSLPESIIFILNYLSQTHTILPVFCLQFSFIYYFAPLLYILLKGVSNVFPRFSHDFPNKSNIFPRFSMIFQDFPGFSKIFQDFSKIFQDISKFLQLYLLNSPAPNTAHRPGATLRRQGGRDGLRRCGGGAGAATPRGRLMVISFNIYHIYHIYTIYMIIYVPYIYVCRITYYAVYISMIMLYVYIYIYDYIYICIIIYYDLSYIYMLLWYTIYMITYDIWIWLNTRLFTVWSPHA